MGERVTDLSRDDITNLQAGPKGRASAGDVISAGVADWINLVREKLPILLGAEAAMRERCVAACGAVAAEELEVQRELLRADANGCSVLPAARALGANLAAERIRGLT